jgi:hypothetical protein
MGVGYWPQNRLSPTKAQRMILLWPWVWIITLLICLGGAENRARMLGWMIVGAVATPLVVWFWVSVLGMTPLNMALPARFSRFILVILGGNPVSARHSEAVGDMAGAMAHLCFLPALFGVPGVAALICRILDAKERKMIRQIMQKP